jgi:hypothetical protein
MKNIITIGSVVGMLFGAQNAQATTYRHVLTMTNNTLYHSMATNGTYSSFNQVPNVPANSVGSVAATTMHNGILVVAYLTNGGLYTITRNPVGGRWSTPQYAGNGASPSLTVGSNNTLYLCVLDTNNKLPYYATKPVAGSWSSWKAVGSSGGLSSYQQVDCDITTESGSNPFVLITDVLNVTATNHTIYHTRLKENVWQPSWGNLTNVANPTCPELGTAGSYLHVESAGVGSELHVISVGYGCLQHTRRAVNGTWTRFGDVKGQAGNPGAVWWATIGSEWGALALIAGTEEAYHLWDTTRVANGSWSPFFDISARVGSSQVWVRPAVASYTEVVIQ